MCQLEDFAAATGLKVNKAKCRIYFGRVDKEEQCNIMRLTEFDKGELPFKYFGVPLDSKKIATYSCLIDNGQANY